METSEVATLGNDVAIGELVTYALVVDLPEGTTPDLTIVDQLPAASVTCRIRPRHRGGVQRRSVAGRLWRDRGSAESHGIDREWR
jgi:hypothetical protein